MNLKSFFKKAAQVRQPVQAPVRAMPVVSPQPAAPVQAAPAVGGGLKGAVKKINRTGFMKALGGFGR